MKPLMNPFQPAIRYPWDTAITLGNRSRFERRAASRNSGYAPNSSRPWKITGALTISDLGLDRDTVSRWRKELIDSHKFDEELERANGKGIRRLRKLS